MQIVKMPRCLIQKALVFLVFTVSLMSCGHRSIAFQELYAGAHGPNVGGLWLFDSAEGVRNSWIKGALNEEQYQGILEKVDFNKELLLAFSFSEFRSYSGKIKIVQIYEIKKEDIAFVNVRIKIGVLGPGCQSNSMAAPFILAVLPKPKNRVGGRGYDVMTFEDGCFNKL